ncbi:MAG: iron-sulfur cluster assembly scaffold protein [Xanthobacteraceae bacterium]
MTAACREPCCSVAPRFTVADLFERGFRRMREAPLAIEGGTIADADGNAARFSIEVDDGKLADARFRASACTTLIAYCEAISELLPGFGVDVVAQLTANELVAALPGVPALKQDRAVLAIAAFRAALRAAIQREHIENPSSSWPGHPRLDRLQVKSWIPATSAGMTIQQGEKQHEGRVYFCHFAPHGFLRARQDDPAAARGRPPRRHRRWHVLLRGQQLRAHEGQSDRRSPA